MPSIAMRLRTLLLLLLAPAVLPAAAGAQAVTLHPDTAAQIDRLFAKYSTRTPGCAVGVARDGREIFTRGYGLAELEHRAVITPATVFEAGSVSKQFTAFLLSLLEQEGRLSLDDPMRKHLPELPDYGAPLTIRQVLSHTSGLRDWYGIAAVQGLVPGEHHFRNADLLEMASRQRALNFPSGSEYLYSNTGWNLLALVVERVTGESFQAASHRRVFEPLGMTQTRWRDDFQAIVPGRAPAYAPSAGGWTHAMPLMSIVGAGGLLTTVHDLLRWNENLSTGRVGGKALVDRMQTRARLVNGREIGYGLGLTISDSRGTKHVSHGGSTGGYRAHVARYPERGLSFAVLCNEAGANVPAEALADVFLGPAPRPQPSALSEGEANAMRGRYRNVATGAMVEIRDARTAPGGYTWAALRRTGDSITAIAGVNAAGDSVVLERVAVWSPTAGELREFVGDYATDEAPGIWRAAVVGDSLVLQDPAGRRRALRPVYRDAFTGGGVSGTVVFRRDRRGRVDALSLMMGRLRDMRLERRATSRQARGPRAAG